MSQWVWKLKKLSILMVSLIEICYGISKTDELGEYKTILQLVTVLSHGKRESLYVGWGLTDWAVAKRLTDRAVDEMEGVQNLRKAVYE